MTPTTASDLSPRFVRLFAQAGLLGVEELQSFGKKHRENKSIADVLHQDVSLGSFKDLLFADVGFKSRNKGAISSELSSTVNIRSDELQAILTSQRPDLEEFVTLLLEVSPNLRGSLRRTLEKADELKKDPYEWLIRDNVINEETTNRFLNSNYNPLLSACALTLSLGILRNNQLLTQDQYDDLLGRISPKTKEANLAAATDAIAIGSPELLEKIESGLVLPEAAWESDEIDESLKKMFPPELIRRSIILPILNEEHRIGIATTDPFNVKLSMLMRWTTGKWIELYYAPSVPIIDRIGKAYGGVQASDGKGTPAHTPISAVVKETAPISRNRERSSVHVETPDDSMSAVQLVSSIIENAIALRATDIHLEPTRESLVVRFRIDGLLKRIMSIPLNLIAPVTSRIKVLANMDVTERRHPMDGHIMLMIEGRHFDFRIATVPIIFGEKIAIRILDSSRLLTGLEDLGMNAKQYAVAERLINQTYGIILVTGPTGSGKTSTLYAAMNEMNEEHRHLVTIEDPVEYQLEGINQINVNNDIGLTFSEGLRAILRQDPNIIMVGEIRDPDTANIAIRAAMTGHLVFSTLHTNTTIGAFQALNQLGASNYMIGSAVIGVIAQRLVRKLCNACKKNKAVSKALAAQLGLEYKKSLRLQRAVGCGECMDSGYLGRVGLFEVIEMTDNLRRGLLAGDTPARLTEIADADGRVSIQETGLEKLKAGITSPEELIEKVMMDA